MTANDDHAAPSCLLTALVLTVAMTFPTLMAWTYFVALGGAGQPSTLQRLTYAAGKSIQFSTPLLFVLFFARQRLVWQRPSTRGTVLGLGFGLLAGGLILAVYFGGLRSSRLLADTPDRIRAKLEEFGVRTFQEYVSLALFLCLIHSFLEEYYWRWFVFGQMRTLVPVWVAILLSSLGFMAHHVLVVWVYAPDRIATVVVPASLGVASGGAVWAWIYSRTDSLLATWSSHALIDLALFVIGWDMIRPS